VRIRVERDENGIATLQPEAINNSETVPDRLVEPNPRVAVPEDTCVRRAINVFGTLRITNGDILVIVPQGHVATLIKALAVSGRRLGVEVLIDILWPDTGVSTGRQRIKNVLSRARKLLGDDWIARAGDVLYLNANIEIDLEAFEQLANRALLYASTSGPETVATAIAALHKLSAPLLVEDHYVEFFNPPRIATQARALALVEVLLPTKSETARARITTPMLVDVIHRIAPERTDYLERIDKCMRNAVKN
jgi:DNA-binding SARP family transcriptional activator